jgi:hypothetical protein
MAAVAEVADGAVRQIVDGLLELVEHGRHGCIGVARDAPLFVNFFVARTASRRRRVLRLSDELAAAVLAFRTLGALCCSLGFGLRRRLRLRRAMHWQNAAGGGSKRRSLRRRRRRCGCRARGGWRWQRLVGLRRQQVAAVFQEIPTRLNRSRRRDVRRLRRQEIVFRFEQVVVARRRRRRRWR